MSLKNQELLFKGYTKDVFPLLRKIPGNKLNNLFNQYIVYCKKTRVVQRILLFFAGIAILHNFFIFSGAYDSNFDYQFIIIGLLVLLLIPCFVVIGILLRGQLKIRRELRKLCLAASLPAKKTRKEFNEYIKIHIGGFGI
ncbi:hypothetical protein [uncultured Maribacter sp.]|uniref:hypothetical protein n=1 Tax=uncultured Maribacter sp. TaxID=431308 RepID=UPI00262A141A|nr:hypothetical protein [uncultured Maribacter sp.]